MDLRSAIKRAKRGVREDTRLYAVAISSLTIAFLCLAVALVGVENLHAIAARWGASGRMTVFLRDGATASDIEQLRLAVEGLAEIQRVELVTSAQARERFLRDSDVDGVLAQLPPDAFPASLELTTTAGVSATRLGVIAQRIQRFSSVEDVEAYRSWFARVESLVTGLRSASAALALLVALCVLAVVGNTIRLAIAGRREEIEVLKLCGATDSFVRAPFLVEGAVQGLLSAGAAVALLLLAFVALRGHVDSVAATLFGARTMFLSPWIAVAIVVGGGVAGVLGSALSLRRYLAV